jgi:hypothetical protein
MISRRQFCLSGAVAALMPVAMAPARVARIEGFDGLQQRALAARARLGSRITAGDRIGMVDFALPSRQPRFHILDMASGARQTVLVAHGKGSDPDHSGWLERFSNEPGSEASSAGAYLTGDLYEGKHGRSRRLIGLDPSNCNAEARALVIHGAWYVSSQMAQDKGKLGRSQGCLAVAGNDLASVLDRLGPGSLIYVDKI